VQIAGSIESLLATHRLLIGPRSGEAVDDVTVIATTDAARQTTLLVRGTPPPRDGWLVLEPSLEEIVLAYLGNPHVQVVGDGLRAPGSTSGGPS
jgi:ABC-2 type transport system ATP-binding protein